MRHRAPKRAERGVTILVVLVLLSVMLLGGLALARMSEIGTLASGNNAYREAALQASEIGVNTGFQRVRALADENTAVAGWYSPTEVAKTADGLPDIDWSVAPTVTVGPYQVRYTAERACTVAVLTAPLRECLVRQEPMPTSRRAGDEPLDPPNSRQFRITVRVSGPKGTQTFVQSLVTKG
jgi:type IV pilus assembly protein PilX